MKALEINHLKKTYPNGVIALKGIDLSVNEGDFFALLGPNGAGKSTTIGIITSMVNKTDGQIKILGHDLDSEHQLAKAKIGLVPQEINLMLFEKVQDVVIDQAGFYGIKRSIAKKRAEKYLKQLQLWEKRKQQAITLSGGQKRRLMIARALVHEPPLLILDEPTAGVDIEIRRSMWQFLREINAAGTTIILTTHYLDEAESLCRNIAIINNGEIIENTSMASLLRKLNMETFILYLDNPIGQVPDIGSYTLRMVDEATLELDLEREKDINTAFAALSDLGIKVNSLRNKANRLEELFVTLTSNTN